MPSSLPDPESAAGSAVDVAEAVSVRAPGGASDAAGAVGLVAKTIARKSSTKRQICSVVRDRQYSRYSGLKC